MGLKKEVITMKRARIKICGRVQGVGFRFHTQQQAERHQIKGWVRNNPDGTVEIEAEGEDQNMEQFIGEIKRGSMGAKVTDVKIENLSPTGDDRSFQIRY